MEEPDLQVGKDIVPKYVQVMMQKKKIQSNIPTTYLRHDFYNERKMCLLPEHLGNLYIICFVGYSLRYMVIYAMMCVWLIYHSITMC